MEKSKPAAKETLEGQPQPTELLTPKKFRQSPELEGFYRFIYENDLRREGAIILDKLMMVRKARRALVKKSKSN